MASKSSKKKWYWVLFFLILSPTACFIPCSKDYIRVPHLRVHVMDLKTQKALQKIPISIIRVPTGPPGRKSEVVSQLLTNEAGWAEFSLEVERLWIFPLMMHGVPFWSHKIKVEVKGYKVFSKKFKYQHEQVAPLIIELNPL